MSIRALIILHLTLSALIFLSYAEEEGLQEEVEESHLAAAETEDDAIDRDTRDKKPKHNLQRKKCREFGMRCGSYAMNPSKSNKKGRRRRDVKRVVRSSSGICSLPKAPGLCKAYLPRFYFDVNTRSCQEFIYGGCGANDNNFVRKEQCEAKCN